MARSESDQARVSQEIVEGLEEIDSSDDIQVSRFEANYLDSVLPILRRGMDLFQSRERIAREMLEKYLDRQVHGELEDAE